MKVVLIANQKGGTGSSTIIPFLCSTYAVNQRLKILAIDAHPFQKSLYHLRQQELKLYPYLKPLFEIVGVDPKDVVAHIANLKEVYDLIIVDWSGRIKVDFYLNSLIHISNFILIPIVGGDTNISSTMEFVKCVKNVKKQKLLMGGSLEFYGVANMYDKRLLHHRAIWDAAISIELPMFRTTLRRSIEYGRYLSTIIPISDVAESKIARQEIIALGTELLGVINCDVRPGKAI